MKLKALGFAAAFGMVAGGGLGLDRGTAEAAPPHVHQLTTPNGKTHTIAQGLCNNWDPAGENFHGNVHTGQPNQTNGTASQITVVGGCPTE
jgi:hypothetical protein